LNDIHLVIRTTGERTASVAKKLAIVSGLVENEVTVVNEIPFEVALRACYEEAIRVGRKWTMTLDADVLLADTAVRRLLGLAEQMPSHFFQIEGKVFDKITGIYRQAGHRIYRTELLPLALEHIPAAGAQIRPEFHTITQMVELGYPSRVVPSLVGVHDFEQYYADLYRKSLVHARKHSELLPNVIARCSRLLPRDDDFLVILKGIWDGLLMQEALTIDVRRYEDQAACAMQSLGLAEKQPIVDSDGFVKMFPRFFSDIRSLYPTPDGAVWDHLPALSESGTKPERVQRSWLAKTVGRIRERGAIRGSVAAFGALLRLAGQRLER
jgi:hypothetical protein